MKKILIAAFVLTAATAPAAAAELVTNGNFEGGANASGNPNAWTVAEGSEIRVNNGFQYQPCCGTSGSNLANNFASFGSGDEPNVSTLSQTLRTVAGAFYTVSFQFGVLGNGQQSIAANALAGTTTLGSVGGTQSANNNLDTTYGTYSFGFTATSRSTVLRFNVDPFTSSVDGIVDNVSVLGAVPEPATWAMMILGFGFVGVAMRHGKRTAKLRFANA